MGWEARVAETDLAGEAAPAARSFLAGAGAGVTAAHGETTVDLGGTSGRGGRNQEAGLAAAVEGEGQYGWAMAALATDGVDGTSEAAGALVDGGTAARIRAAGDDPVGHLEGHDSHPALAAAGDVIVTGPTGTNVADLWIVLRAG
jgi:hydroxypyruvate reductase